MGIATSKPQSPEIWVAPDGNDNNSGSVDSPYKTLQAAVDDLDDLYGADTTKTLRLMPGTYSSVNIHTQNWRIIGEGSAMRGADFKNTPVIECDGASGIGVLVTNLTRDSYAAFQADGDISFTASGGTWTWDGAALAGREVNYAEDDSNFDASGVLISGVMVDATDPTVDGKHLGVAVLLSPGESGTDVHSGDVQFDQVFFNCDCLFKNTFRMGFSSCNTATWDYYFDVAENNELNSCFFSGNVHFRPTPTTLADEGTNKFGGSLHGNFLAVTFTDLIYYGGSGHEIRNAHIEGDLYSYADSVVNCFGLMVEGSLQGDGDINFTGGGWVGANSNTGTVTHTALTTTP